MRIWDGGLDLSQRASLPLDQEPFPGFPRVQRLFGIVSAENEFVIFRSQGAPDVIDYFASASTRPRRHCAVPFVFIWNVNGVRSSHHHFPVHFETPNCSVAPFLILDGVTPLTLCPEPARVQAIITPQFS